MAAADTGNRVPPELSATTTRRDVTIHARAVQPACGTTCLCATAGATSNPRFFRVSIVLILCVPTVKLRVLQLRRKCDVCDESRLFQNVPSLLFTAFGRGNRKQELVKNSFDQIPNSCFLNSQMMFLSDHRGSNRRSQILQATQDIVVVWHLQEHIAIRLSARNSQ